MYNYINIIKYYKTKFEKIHKKNKVVKYGKILEED